MYPRVPTGTLHRCHLTPCPGRDTAQEAGVSCDGTSSTEKNSASLESLQCGGGQQPPRLQGGTKKPAGAT